MPLKILYALSFVVFCFFSTPALAQEANTAMPIGTIAEIEGVVAMAEDGETIMPEVGREIYLNDVIETGPDSKALILFIDDTELTISENARFTVDEYVFDEQDPETNKGRFNVTRGAFIFVSGLIGKNEQPDVKIETNYGSIGIRGTVVWGGAIDDEYNVFVQEGEVFFATDRGRVTVKEGQGTKVRNRRAIPSRAKAWGQEKIGRAVRTVALKNPQAVKERVSKMKARHAEMRQKHIEKIKGKRSEKREQIQQQRRERQEMRQQKQLEHRPTFEGDPAQRKEKRQEKKTEMKERFLENRSEKMEEKREQIQERREEKREEVIEDLRGGDTAPDFEHREKMHLKRQMKPRSKN